MRDLVIYRVCKPKCEDRRRPPYLRRSRSAAPIRRSSDGQAEAKPKQMFFLSCSSNRVKRDSYSSLILYSFLVKIDERNGEERAEGKGRPISTRRGEAAPYLPSVKSPSCNYITFVLDSMFRVKGGWVGMVYEC